MTGKPPLAVVIAGNCETTPSVIGTVGVPVTEYRFEHTRGEGDSAR